MMIPVAAINEISVQPHPEYLGASVVTIHLGAVGFDIVLPQDSAAALALAG